MAKPKARKAAKIQPHEAALDDLRLFNRLPNEQKRRAALSNPKYNQDPPGLFRIMNDTQPSDYKNFPRRELDRILRNTEYAHTTPMPFDARQKLFDQRNAIHAEIIRRLDRAKELGLPGYEVKVGKITVLETEQESLALAKYRQVRAESDHGYGVFQGQDVTMLKTGEVEYRHEGFLAKQVREKMEKLEQENQINRQLVRPLIQEGL